MKFQLAVATPLLLSVLILVPSRATADGAITLTVTRGAGPGQGRLDWVGQDTSYAVFRSATANQLITPSNKIGDLWTQSLIDDTPAVPILFFSVEGSTGVANVRDFGAAGDGTSDDTAAIQSAFNSGRTHVVFPDGNYSTNMLTVPPTLHAITGDGTLLQRAAGQDVIRAISAVGLSVSGLRFVGVGGSVPESSNSGIHVTSSTRVTVSNSEFSGFRDHAVLVEGSSDVRVTDNIVYGVSGGIKFTGVQRGSITGNTVRDSQLPDHTFTVAICLDSTDGHSFGFCSDIIISNNVVANYVNAQAILVHAGERITVTGNVLDDVLFGVSASPFNATDVLTDIVIQGNVYRGASRTGASATTGNYGIFVGGGQGYTVDRALIVGNTVSAANSVVRDVAQGGIGVGYSDDTAVVGNLVSEPYAAGVALNNPNNRVLVSDNLLLDVVDQNGTRSGVRVTGVSSGHVEGNLVVGATSGMQFDANSAGFLLVGPNDIRGASTNYEGPSNATIKTTFGGDVDVEGTLTKNAGAFRIRHPLDPGKYLQHSFVESPDMLNMYQGIATLDSHGEAWVTLPSWFEALNKDFRYQLTAIGVPGPTLYVANEVANNRFKISGGAKEATVSWQVSGTRRDPYAEANRIQVEPNAAVGADTP